MHMLMAVSDLLDLLSLTTCCLIRESPPFLLLNVAFKYIYIYDHSDLYLQNMELAHSHLSSSMVAHVKTLLSDPTSKPACNWYPISNALTYFMMTRNLLHYGFPFYFIFFALCVHACACVCGCTCAM